MTETQLDNHINCGELSPDEINYKVKSVMFNKFKNILLTNVYGKQGLLEGLRGGVKIEILGDADSGFANKITEIKIIVNGSVGNDSACYIKSSKLTVFGSCGKRFGNNAQESEFYVFENCGSDSFSGLSDTSKVIIGGVVGNTFGACNQGGIILILNLKGGSLYLEDDFLRDIKAGIIYIRGDKDKIKILNNRFSLGEVKDNDDDVYLPLISEFARLFNYSLSEIKSKPFYKAIPK